MDTVRLSVCSGSRRADLTTSAAVPVAELVPDLAAVLGLRDPAVLVLLDGTALDLDAGLSAQGVVDGQVLLLVDSEVTPPVVHDDPAEALAEVMGTVMSEVRSEVRSDRPEPGRPSSLASAVLLGSAAVTLTSTWSPPDVIAIGATVLLGVATLAGSAAPAVALAVAGVSAPWPEDPPTAVDLERLAKDAALAHRILSALTTVLGILPVLVAPLAARLGAAGAAVCLVSACLLLVRSQRWHSPAGSSRSPRRRPAENLETACIVLLPPLLLVASGLLDRLPG